MNMYIFNKEETHARTGLERVEINKGDGKTGIKVAHPVTFPLCDFSQSRMVTQ